MSGPGANTEFCSPKKNRFNVPKRISAMASASPWVPPGEMPLVHAGQTFLRFLGIFSGRKKRTGLKHDEICCSAYLLDIFEIDIWWYMMIYDDIDCVPKQSCCYQTLTSWLVQCYFAAKWGSACACGNAYQRMYCAQLNCSCDGISQVTVVLLLHSSLVLISLWSAFAVDVVVLNMLNAQQSLDIQ